MNQTDAIRLTYEALWLVVQLSAPPVLAVAAVGLIVALLQAATQVQEQTVQFVAKFVVLVIALFATAALLSGQLQAFADRVFSDIPTLPRR
ncbi:MAG: Flagellar biosynthetic protein FliQ [Pseudomonadota bacterium]|jgi:type III secretion protein S